MTIDASERRNAGARRGAVATERSDSAAPYRRIGTLNSTERDPASAQSTYFVKIFGEDLLEFGEEEYFLWRLLDGSNSVADIQAKFQGRFGTPLTAGQFDSFISQLIDCGAAEPLPADEAALPKPAAIPSIMSSIERPEAELPLRPEAVPWTIAAFDDPSLLLRVLDSIAGPLRFYRWAFPAAVVGVLIWFGLVASEALSATITLPLSQVAPSMLTGGLIGLLLAATVPAVSQAVVATYFSCATPTCRVVLWQGLIPRLLFDDAGWRTLGAAQVLQVVGAPCLAKLVLATVALGLWLAEPRSAWMSPALLGIVLVSLTNFLISAAPFGVTEGRRWLATAFGVPDPWRAGPTYRVQAGVLSVFWFAVAAGLTVVFGDTALRLAHPAWYTASTAQSVQSATWPLLALAVIVIRMWLKGMLRSYGTLLPSYQPVHAYADLPEALDPGGPSTARRLRQPGMLGEGVLTPPRRPATERINKSTIVWAVIIGLCIAIVFVAYPYEAGGAFTILPYDSAQLNARVAGELTEALVNEGDTVKPGQILGILSDWQEKYNLAAAKAQLENAQATLQNLLDQPQWESVELARKQYEAALSRLPYDKAQLERYAALVTNDNVSRANYDQVLSQYQQDQAAAEVARANYDSVRAPPTPDQIEAQRAMVRQYTAAVAYAEDQLERTRIRATSHGTMITPNPMLLRGQWFNQGALVFAVEDHRVLQADVQVPETDIDNVRLGGPVRLRLWGAAETTVIGKSIAVAPDAQSATLANNKDVQTGTSNVIRVRVEVPNPDGKLHPQTDGYAKMNGYYMPTWRAFGLMLERFFLVEIWSWIP